MTNENNRVASTVLCPAIFKENLLIVQIRVQLQNFCGRYFCFFLIPCRNIFNIPDTFAISGKQSMLGPVVIHGRHFMINNNLGHPPKIQSRIKYFFVFMIDFLPIIKTKKKVYPLLYFR